MKSNNRTTSFFASMAGLHLACGAALAQPTEPPTTEPAPTSETAQPTPTTPPPTPPTPPAAPHGILPIPDYTGELLSRRYLLGDLDGARTDLANKGIQFGVDWTQYVHGVASGGRDNEIRYGGAFDYDMTFDLMRMNLLPLAYVKLRAESRYGKSINAIAGPILPVNTDLMFPLTDQIDEGIPFTITSFNLTKLINPKFGFIVGKLDTLDGDPNEFASGRGTSQFMNSNFVFNSALALRLPYSTLGGGLVWMPTPQITVTSMVMNTADSSTTTGFEDFGDGGTWNTEAHFQYGLGSLPGGVNAGFLYSFDQDFAKLNSRFVFEPGEGLVIPTTDETWAVYFSGWQYLWVKGGAKSHPINITDGIPDYQGLGLFWRLGFADEDTNPVDWSLSAGLGGRGIIPSRDHDLFGVGYFYTSLQTDRLTGLPGIRNHSQGFEAYYSIGITPATHLTIDIQVVESLTNRTDTSVLLGMRLGLEF